MKRITTGLRYGLVAMLFYVAIRGGAAAWASQRDHNDIGGIWWAAFNGGRFLDQPGYRLLDRWKGPDWALQPPPSERMAVEEESSSKVDEGAGADTTRPVRKRPPLPPLTRRDQAALFVVAVPMAVLGLIGFAAGVIHGPYLPSSVLADTDAPECRVGKSMSHIALAMALAGTAGYGFLTGFFAVVIAFRARRHLPCHASGRGLAMIAVIIGTLVSLAWIFALIAHWHPVEAP